MCPSRKAAGGAIDSIYSLVDLSFTPTTQLLSGPSGSGKTTELRRLKRDLEELGFTVVMVNMLEYVSQSAEIDAADFLIALGLAFGEQLLPEPDDEETRGFAARLRRFLQRVKVSVDVGPAQVTASGEGVSASAGARVTWPGPWRPSTRR